MDLGHVNVRGQNVDLLHQGKGTEADFVARLVKLATVCCLFLAIHHNVT